MSDRIVFLGTKGGPSVRKGGPMPSSSLLQLNGKTYVIDCGLGVTRSLVNADVTLPEIDAIFITHLHCDHILELGPLIYTAWVSGRTAPLDVFGPAGLVDYWAHFMAAMSFDHGLRTGDGKRPALSELVTIHPTTEGHIADLGTTKISAKRVDHPPVTDCFALRFDTPEHSIVMSADTCYFPPLADFAAGADVLVHEALLGDGIDVLVTRLNGGQALRDHLLAGHTMVQDVGRIATAANVGHLILNHLVPADDLAFTIDDWQSAIASNWTGPMTVATDGLSIALPLERLT
jgi:ribonuclease BN (tRNA processing enzyme)